MPLYRIRCVECGRGDEVYRRVDDRDNLPAHCGKPMARVIVAPMVAADIQPYRSMIDGTWITSRSQHRDHLREHRCVELGNDVPKDIKPRPLTAPPGLKETIIGVANEKLRG